VKPEQLISSYVHVDGAMLLIGDDEIDLTQIERIAIVGAGKAAGALAVAVENALGPERLAEKQVVGWINVPDDCVVPAQRVTLHASRPAAVNEPRAAGVHGTKRILDILTALGPNDLCFCLLTGGGSALMPAPAPGISLEQKIAVTRLLSAAGANIEQLNTVRRHLSLVKGGGLARACRAGRLVTLVISDVLGDSLQLIASGPTVPGTTTAADALDVLETRGLTDEPTIAATVRFLRDATASVSKPLLKGEGPSCMTHHILANNATAVDAAGVEAERLGYSHALISANKSEGPAEDVGRHLAAMGLQMRDQGGPNCLISGGEPTVTLVDESSRGKGGRNQQLALAALLELRNCERIALLAGGTDGEDGPTDAAGAFAIEEVVRNAGELRLDPRIYLSRNNAYRFFEQTGGLFITGPTYTNVCDLRVLLVNR
jgi:hydroxypyruvate reductase